MCAGSGPPAGDCSEDTFPKGGASNRETTEESRFIIGESRKKT